MIKRRIKKAFLFGLAFFALPIAASAELPGNTPKATMTVPIPLLNTNLPQNKETVLTLKQDLQKLIGSKNIDNLNPLNRDTLFESIRTQGTNASSSCGPKAFAYEQILHAHKINAHMIAFYTLKGNNITGHTATEVSLDNKNWFVVDPHANVVWQNKNNEWANALKIGCQALCNRKNYTSWEYYPSVSGNEPPNANVIENTLEIMFTDFNVFHDPTISAIGLSNPTDYDNAFNLSELLIFKDANFTEKAQQKLFETLEGPLGLYPETKITYYDKQSCACNIG